ISSQMGSKRRHDDEDDVSLKKRRKRDDNYEEIATALETPNKKRKSKGHELESNGVANGDVSFAHNEDDDECVVYLIRKPKALSIEDLEAKLSLKSKVKNKTRTMELDSGAVYTTRIAPSDSFMYHVPMVDGDLAPGNRIAGTVTITQNETKNEEGDFIMHNDFLEDPPLVSMPFVIAPIKRNPVLEMDGLKQRLHAYGCTSADSEETPRKVKKAKRKSKRADNDE
ncbi:hypothetical protein PENTCL1PPCAC_25187, partial [Pristionchus entomophagus]